MKPNFRARCARINRLLGTAYGLPKWPGPQDPLDVLIRTILAQLTTAAGSDKALAALKGGYKSWEHAADSTPDSLTKTMRSAGLAAQKAKSIVKLLKDLKREYGAASLDFIKTMSVREAMRALESIEGVGPKVGACVILFSLGREICPVDAHIHRILQRMGIIPTTATPESAFETLQPLIPSGQSYAFHMNMIRLGREFCKASKPKCGDCPVETECRYPAKRIVRKVR
jgi:endonuclease-3